MEVWVCTDECDDGYAIIDSNNCLVSSLKWPHWPCTSNHNGSSSRSNDNNDNNRL